MVQGCGFYDKVLAVKCLSNTTNVTPGEQVHPRVFVTMLKSKALGMGEQEQETLLREATKQGTRMYHSIQAAVWWHIAERIRYP